MSGWQKYEPEYPTRDILPGDIAARGENTM